MKMRKKEREAIKLLEGVYDDDGGEEDQEKSSGDFDK